VDGGVDDARPAGRSVGERVAVAIGSGVGMAVTVRDGLSVGSTEAVQVGRGASANGDKVGSGIDDGGGMLLGVAWPGSCQASSAPSKASTSSISGATPWNSALVALEVGLGRLHVTCS
jgi:hypothetical protein